VAPGFGDFTRASAAAKGMFKMIDRQSKIDPLAETGERPSDSDGSVRLCDVTFAYPSRPTIKVLQNVSLTFEADKVTALVGASGSGKSTIVGLIERWFDPDAGSIRVGNYVVAHLNLRWLRSQIGLVQQEPVLFSDTIYNNVAHGLYSTPMNALPEDEKRELVRQACIQAYADDFIQELPDKYDTRVGDRGGLLSGGQKQRIAIARSVISNPRILLLDEATSALDPAAEKKVQAALDNVSKSRTTIMIAHKLSTVQKADKIIVLSRGEVVEEGTHQQLLGLKGTYHKLVNAQALNTKQTDAQDGRDASESTECSSDDWEAADEPATFEESIPGKSNPSKPVADQANADEEAGGESEDKDVARKFSLVKCLSIIIFKEQTHIWPIFLAGFIASVAGGGLFPAQAVLFGKSIPTLQLPPGSELVSRGNFWALMYFVLGLGVLCCYLGVGFFWTIAAFHATRFYRREYFDSMLRQDISFFDLAGHGAADMTSCLSLHPQRLQNLLSTNLALILVIIVNITSCAILSLAVGWQLGLVAIVGGMPVLFGAGFIRMRIEMTNHDRVSQIYLECARFASEAVGAIRTVSSLTLEDKVLEGYRSRLAECARHEVRTKFVSMVLYALSESVSLAVSALAFWYGGKLLSEGKYDVTTFFIVFICVVMGSHAAGFLFGFTSGEFSSSCCFLSLPSCGLTRRARHIESTLRSKPHHRSPQIPASHQHLHRRQGSTHERERGCRRHRIQGRFLRIRQQTQKSRAAQHQPQNQQGRIRRHRRRLRVWQEHHDCPPRALLRHQLRCPPHRGQTT
jgi:ATP-binding cassette, subfamily B (MDR/TAP), member 1